METEKVIRVVLFDDNDLLRDSLFHLIDEADGYKCVGEFPDCEKLLKNISGTQPDVILMDIDMPGINGIEAVLMIKEKFPEIKILMQTVFDDNNKIFDSLCAGASGYILKSTLPHRYLEAIKEIYEGGVPMTPSVAVKVLKMFRNQSEDVEINSFSLTKREKEILSLLVKGMSYKLIADQCFISLDTVNNHIRNIYKKMQVHSKGEAVAKAIKGRIV